MQSQPGKAGATACEFRTAHELTMWPLELTQVEYFTHAADLPIAAMPEWRRYLSGLRIRIKSTAGLDFSQIALQDLRLHCAGIDDRGLSAARTRVRPRDGCAGVADAPACGLA